MRDMAQQLEHLSCSW